MLQDRLTDLALTIDSEIRPVELHDHTLIAVRTEKLSLACAGDLDYIGDDPGIRDDCVIQKYPAVTRWMRAEPC
jgi:hypothetical protein